jgi:hypothetical protein
MTVRWRKLSTSILCPSIDTKIDRMGLHATQGASPIYEEHGRGPFMTGPSNDFLLPIGAGRTNGVGVMPQQLRQGGWVFLRAGRKIVARARFIGFEQRESRVEHVPSATGYEDRGPGLVLAVDPATWEDRADRLESDREPGNGYRYYMIDGEHPVWTLAGS